MKKTLSILFLFVFSLFLTMGQTKVTTEYVDSVKSVNVNVAVDNVKKQQATENKLQLQLSTVVDNQLSLERYLTDAIVSLNSGIVGYTKEVEIRNKADSKTVLDKFGYTPSDVEHTIRKELRLNFILGLFSLVYLLYITFQFNKEGAFSLSFFTVKLTFLLTYGFVGFFILKWLLTLIFNGDFYVIKELIKIST